MKHKRRKISNKGFALAMTMVIVVIFGIFGTALATSDLAQIQRRTSTNLKCEQRMVLDRAAQTALKIYTTNTDVDDFVLNIEGISYTFTVSVSFGEAINTITITPANSSMTKKLTVEFTSDAITSWKYSTI